MQAALVLEIIDIYLFSVEGQAKNRPWFTGKQYLH